MRRRSATHSPSPSSRTTSCTPAATSASAARRSASPVRRRSTRRAGGSCSATGRAPRSTGSGDSTRKSSRRRAQERILHLLFARRGGRKDPRRTPVQAGETSATLPQRRCRTPRAEGGAGTSRAGPDGRDKRDRTPSLPHEQHAAGGPLGPHPRRTAPLPPHSGGEIPLHGT